MHVTHMQRRKEQDHRPTDIFPVLFSHMEGTHFFIAYIEVSPE